MVSIIKNSGKCLTHRKIDISALFSLPNPAALHEETMTPEQEWVFPLTDQKKITVTHLAHKSHSAVSLCWPLLPFPSFPLSLPNLKWEMNLNLYTTVTIMLMNHRPSRWCHCHHPSSLSETAIWWNPIDGWYFPNHCLHLRSQKQVWKTTTKLIRRWL